MFVRRWQTFKLGVLVLVVVVSTGCLDRGVGRSDPTARPSVAAADDADDIDALGFGLVGFSGSIAPFETACDLSDASFERCL